jgi:hypothetical protein
MRLARWPHVMAAAVVLAMVAATVPVVVEDVNDGR